MKDENKEQRYCRILKSCIIRQLEKMNLANLREAYTAVSEISDRKKPPR